MSITTQYTVGGAAVGEQQTLLRPRRNWQGRRAVVWCHGANRSGIDGVSTGYADVPRAIAEDFPVLYSDLGGLYTWGNDLSQTRINDARTWMAAQGAFTDKVILAAGSMGAAAACNFARTYPGFVHGLALFIPAVDVEAIRAGNRLGTAASIEAAYTNLAGWTAARPTHNPIEYAATALSTFPIRIWYSSDDPVCLPSEVEAFATAVGAELTSVGASGHDVAGIDLIQVRDWIKRLDRGAELYPDDALYPSDDLYPM